MCTEGHRHTVARSIVQFLCLGLATAISFYKVHQPSNAKTQIKQLNECVSMSFPTAGARMAVGAVRFLT